MTAGTSAGEAAGWREGRAVAGIGASTGALRGRPMGGKVGS